MNEHTNQFHVQVQPMLAVQATILQKCNLQPTAQSTSHNQLQPDEAIMVASLDQFRLWLQGILKIPRPVQIWLSLRNAKKLDQTGL